MKIKFLPQNISVDVEPGKSVMELARENKLSISSSCNGMCSCAECRVYVVEGETHILPPSAKEVELIGGGYFIDNRRLSCQLFCFGDVTVDLSEQVEREKQGGIIKKQFLKQLLKASPEESSSLGGILIEQDQEIEKVHVPKENDSPSYRDEFYEVPESKTNQKTWQNKKRYKIQRSGSNKENDNKFKSQQRNTGGKRSYRKKRNKRENRKGKFGYGKKRG